MVLKVSALKSDSYWYKLFPSTFKVLFTNFWVHFST